jgi:hypothetical protein
VSVVADPERLLIPAIEVDAPIVDLRLDENGQNGGAPELGRHRLVAGGLSLTHPPVTEQTSDTAGASAIAWAVSGMAATSACRRTMAVITTRS